MGRGRKGSVSIGVQKGWLRLRWTYLGRPYTLALGMPNGASGRARASILASQIELDIAAGHFDKTLDKYRPDRQRRSNLTVTKLFEDYRNYRAGLMTSDRSLEKYDALQNHLQDFFNTLRASTVDEKYAIEFQHYLLDKLSPKTAKQHLGLLVGCWRWAMDRSMLNLPTNIWLEVARAVKIPPKKPAKVFSAEEIGAIISASKSDPRAQHYKPYIEFLLFTGCRPGEARALCWKHLNEDCSSVWIGEALDSKGRRRPSKNFRDRHILLTERLQSTLLAIERGNPNEPLFSSPTGRAINHRNFTRRIWKPLLESLEIPYRKPYNSRHTVVTRALESGHDPVTVASLTGHRVETLFKNYAHVLDGERKLPELFED